MESITTTIIGTCIFRNEGNGCLTAKYMNESKEGPFVECCVGTDKSDPKNFVGNYKTTWIEDGNKCEHGVLIIEPHPLNSKNLFKLTWKVKDKDVFHGHGMLFQDFLATAYWGVQVN